MLKQILRYLYSSYQYKAPQSTAHNSDVPIPIHVSLRNLILFPLQ